MLVLSAVQEHSVNSDEPRPAGRDSLIIRAVHETMYVAIDAKKEKKERFWCHYAGALLLCNEAHVTAQSFDGLIHIPGHVPAILFLCTASPCPGRGAGPASLSPPPGII